MSTIIHFTDFCSKLIFEGLTHLPSQLFYLKFPNFCNKILIAFIIDYNHNQI
jgi:hypothetical protein